ncbi:hypothetical protein ACIOJE_35180 [Kitasatospora sp. NPDC087861]|uniref:hypothetical protein n=1 Tax=Kitasatospora sp. NPDC087861 TaxID=3364070 RepID=UPI0038111E81
MDSEGYIPGLLARLEVAAGGWLTPPHSGRLVLADLPPLMRGAAAATSGTASRLWAHAERVTSARLWVVGDVDGDREVWERVVDVVERAAAARPAVN